MKQSAAINCQGRRCHRPDLVLGDSRWASKASDVLRQYLPRPRIRSRLDGIASRESSRLSVPEAAIATGGVLRVAGTALECCALQATTGATSSTKRDLCIIVRCSGKADVMVSDREAASFLHWQVPDRSIPECRSAGKPCDYGATCAKSNAVVRSPAPASRADSAGSPQRRSIKARIDTVSYMVWST